MQENKILRCFIVLFICALASPAISQHTPQTTYEGAPSTPAWATLMYESPEDYEGVRSGYEDWRKENPGVKNQHSQYYKRWIRKQYKPSADEAGTGTPCRI